MVLKFLLKKMVGSERMVMVVVVVVVVVVLIDLIVI